MTGIDTQHVIFAAAENGALPGGKVGGVGDVIRDLPVALAKLGWRATVITPAYGALHRLPGATLFDTVEVPFAGERHRVEIFEVPGGNEPVRNLVFEHALFSPGGPGMVYTSDEPGRPFASDANKFAFFGAALAEWLASGKDTVDVLHLHDWHTGFYLLLREFEPRFAALRALRTVFTIHNLAYQGTRPLAGDDSSLESWYPGLRVDIARIRDPNIPGCLNPMAAAIRLSDKIATVSSTYALEICQPSNHDKGFIGGEGLEADLGRAARDGRLVGILNGCDYSGKRSRRPGWPQLVNRIGKQVDAWRQKDDRFEGHALAASRVAAMPRRRPAKVFVSVGRLVTQKVSLFLERLPNGRTALETLLERHPDAIFLLLGSGEPDCERRILDIARQMSNLVFLRGYAETLADDLYRSADLFLMPSSFEPCGISQMLAMRDGVPCVVHGVGGLKDTVEHGKTGFVFSGAYPMEQATNFVASIDEALALRAAHPRTWQNIQQAAAACRFDWQLAAKRTVEELYDR